MRQKKDVMDTDSLILFYLESLDKSEKKEFTYSNLVYQITHIYRLKAEFAKNIIDDLIRLGFFRAEIKDDKIMYSKNFEAEKFLIFKINKKKLKEFTKKLNIKKIKIRKKYITF